MRVTKEIPSFFNEVLVASLNDWRKSHEEGRPFSERLMYLNRLDAAISNLVERQKEYL